MHFSCFHFTTWDLILRLMWPVTFDFEVWTPIHEAPPLFGSSQIPSWPRGEAGSCSLTIRNPLEWMMFSFYLRWVEAVDVERYQMLNCEEVHFWHLMIFIFVFVLAHVYLVKMWFEPFGVFSSRSLACFCKPDGSERTDPTGTLPVARLQVLDDPTPDTMQQTVDSSQKHILLSSLCVHRNVKVFLLTLTGAIRC